MDITLLPGNSRIELEGMVTADTGGIVLPESVKSQRVFIGRVKDCRMTPKDRAFIGVDDMTGLRVVVSQRVGRWLCDAEWIVPNLIAIDAKKKKFASPFLAIIPDDMKLNLAAMGDGDKRCKFCGPAISRVSHNNVMLTPHPKHGFYCPRCNRNEHGDKIDPNDVI